ncbi:uncharacterized protein LOC109546927 isoform X1 [Dendroctonus ponderosae]|uniref:CRAL-TRIO domain-containing protein n=1 Tax=Dendroctonus ponderosae TaxID=77166 RepID=A0AAR5QKD9_DENPD|nr:uncharacterized protein LOC109546927 isoform X1 [Dendroctonus ponderosae]KAH1009197.1 hypothetical protein HUJ04_001591 [Dendroctonus ponderosae]KAH1017162.1 hypothetical protein HUJ05_007864 [Dendroctonus ponderosae]
MTPPSYLETNEAIFYEKIFNEFGKTQKEVEQYVDILRKWSEKQSHWPEMPTLNGLLYCILVSKFSIENAKKRTDMYYTIKGLMPEIFTVHPSSPEVIKHSEIAYCVPIPKPTKSHERIFYVQLNPDYNPEDFKIELFFIQITHMVEVIIQEDKCYNFHIIFNASGIKIGHLARTHPMVLKKMSICFEKVYGYRVASIFVVNTYPYLDTFVNKLAMHLAVEKIRNRMKVSRNSDVLFEAFDKSLLPTDIGGEGLSLKELRLLLLKEFERMTPRFDRLQTMRTDESLRPAELQNDDTLGYYGNFKKLDLD